MKRQLGSVMAAVLLLCALAWSQTTTTSSSSSGSSSTATSSGQTPFTNSAYNAWSDSSKNGNGGSSSTSSSSSSTSSSSTTPVPSSNLSSWQTPFSSSSNSSSPDSGQNGASGAPNGPGDTQNGTGDVPQVGAQGPQDTFSFPEALPGLSLFSDAVAHTGVNFNASAGTFLQDVNSYGSTTLQSLSLFTAGVSIGQVHPKYNWAVGYTGGVDTTTGFSAYTYSTLNQSASANVRWDFARHWQLRIKDSYFYSDNPFTPYFTYLGNPTPNQPNPVVYFPQAVVQQNQGHIDVTRELTSRDVINFSGGESFQRYERVFNYNSFYNSFSYSGSVFYQHAFSARFAAGGGYQFSAIDFAHGQSRAGVGTFEIFGSYAVSPRIQVSGWLGPQLTHTKDLVVLGCLPPFGCLIEEKHLRNFNLAEGGTFKWKLRSADSFGLDLTHGVSDGGALLGVSNIYSATAAYNRVLTHGWILGVGGLYGNTKSVATYRTDQYLRSITGTVGLTRKIFSDAWVLNAYYAFIHQSQNYTGTPLVVGTNGIGVTVRYSWNLGLGR